MQKNVPLPAEKFHGKFQIAELFAVLNPAQGVSPVTVSPSLYQDLDKDFDHFKGHWLLSRYCFDSAWTSWERHPAGDEIVFLLSGDVELTMETPDGDARVRLSAPGEYIIVPRNTWHTARPFGIAEMLFITPGEGTEHRSA